MYVEVTSTKPGILPGLGELQPGNPITLDEAQLDRFARRRGRSLGEMNLPQHVELTYVYDEDEE